MKNITKNYTNLNKNYSFALQSLLRNLFRYDPTIVDGCLQQSTGNKEPSFLRSFVIIWKQVALCSLLSYSLIICSPGLGRSGGGGSHINVTSLTHGNLKENP